MRIVNILLFVSLVGCAFAEPKYIETDKIHIFFGEDNNTSRIVAEDYAVSPIYLNIDIENVSYIEVADVSSNSLRCTEDILKSPSELASFSLNPKQALKKITFRIRLPCASYHNEFYIMVKVRSQGGNYFLRKKVPVLITHESPGYFAPGHEYSGALPD